MSSQLEPTPLVIVEGFLSSAGAIVWGNFEEHSNYACQSNGEQNRRTIFASVGPVSSLHDRACELFYSLVGGTVDYGLEHAQANSHGRYGRTYEDGLYPQWSTDHPLHFLGHSMGGPTIVKLQWLLSTGFFGEKYSADMVLSVNAVSAPFRGTQLVYRLGEDIHNAPAVRPFSLGDILAKGVHVAAYLSPILPRFLDLHADARDLSFRRTSLWSLLCQLRKSDWAESRDATPYDATFEAADEREALNEGAVHPKTFYRSYCATLNDPSSSSSPSTSSAYRKSWFSWLTQGPFHASATAISNFDFSILRPIPAFMKTVAAAKHASKLGNTAAVEDGVIDVATGGDYLSASLRANDGVVPLFSQWHPCECSATRCKHFSHGDNILDDDGKTRYICPPEAGVWNVHHLAQAHHFSIVPFWLGTPSQKAFWLDLGHWLRAIDKAHPDVAGGVVGVGQHSVLNGEQAEGSADSASAAVATQSPT
ncbi:alpha/beta-hydrolase [Trametes meyenii]|nr:alpha/beta-hydrolase [Trametes meyenii]